MWTFTALSVLLSVLIDLGKCQLGSLSEMLSDPTMSKLLTGGGGMGGMAGLGGMGGLGGMAGLGGGGGSKLSLGGGGGTPDISALLENPMSALTDPTMARLLASGGGGGLGSSGGLDPAMLQTLIDMSSAPAVDTNMMAQMAELLAPTTAAPTPSPKKSTPAKVSTINLSIGETSSTLGDKQSLADLIRTMQMRRKKKKARNAIQTAQKIAMATDFTATLTPSNLNKNLPAAKMLELAKDGVGVRPALQNMICPTKQCPFPLPCGNPVKTYSPETFFVCPECPMCPGDILKGVSARLGKVVRIAKPKASTTVNIQMTKPSRELVYRAQPTKITPLKRYIDKELLEYMFKQ